MNGGVKSLPLLVLMNIQIWPVCCTGNHEKINNYMYSHDQSKNNSLILIISFLCFIIDMLLIIAGIESNPGPSDFDSVSSSSISTDFDDISSVFENGVSFVHLNVQSILPKINQIMAEYSFYDILSFTESWLNHSISDDDVTIPTFNIFRNDRADRIGGGVVVFVKDNINCKPRPDLQFGNVESIWLEINLKNKIYLYGTFYIPPNSSQHIWECFSQSLEMALNTNKDIIVTGDFNINQNLQNPNDKIKNLLTQYSLQQLITENTYYTENSASLLDLIIVSNPHSVIYSEVGCPLLDQVRYHLPIKGLISHPKETEQSFKRKIYLYDKGDYSAFRQQLAEVDWDILFENENNIDEITSK